MPQDSRSGRLRCPPPNCNSLLQPSSAVGLLGNPVPIKELRLLPSVALAPFVNGVNEVPFSRVTMLFSSHPPNDLLHEHDWLASFGRKYTSLATKMFGRLMLVFPLSMPGIAQSGDCLLVDAARGVVQFSTSAN